jgi:hypothetical protein
MLAGRLQAQTFAVIGDFGWNTQNELDVSNLVKSWNPDLIITVGDNNYPNGGTTTMDPNVGQYYHEFIYPYTGTYGPGAAGVNKFFPTLGNHDVLTSSGQPYFNYFTLPNNERYYDHANGNVHFFALNSDPSEPDGFDSTSAQAMWLKNALQNATEKWKIVYFHHAPYSSDVYCGNSSWMQWPFKAWGASAVLTGHAHTYERIVLQGFPYFINGMGGDYPDPNAFGNPVQGSAVRFSSDNGAMRLDAAADSLVLSFITRAGNTIDRYVLHASPSSAVEMNEPATFAASYPNPFKGTAEIKLSTSEPGSIELCVYSVTGAMVKTVHWNNHPAGEQLLKWNSDGLQAGFYVYRIKVNDKWQAAGHCIVAE